MSLKFTSVPTKTLAESITASATSFRLNNITGWDSEALAAADFGTEAYVIFRNAAKTQVELMKIDPSTIASTDITITLRGLQFDGNLTTEVSANKLAWSRGDTFVDLGTDTPQMFQWLKEYIDAASIAGAVPAENATAGIVKIAGTTELNADDGDDGTYDYVPNAATLAASKYGLRLPTADEKAALAGGGDFGAPSASNKFLTEEWHQANPETTIAAKELTQDTNTFSNTEDTLISISIPGNTLGTDGGVRFTAYFSLLTIPTSLNVGLTFKIKYGTTTFATINPTGVATSVSNNTKGVISGLLLANGTTSSQKGFAEVRFCEAGSEDDAETAVSGDKIFGFGEGTAAEDSTGALNFVMTIQSTSTSGSQQINREIVLIEKIGTTL